MLRLDVSRDDFPSDPARDYGIPASNPFAGRRRRGRGLAVRLAQSVPQQLRPRDRRTVDRRRRPGLDREIDRVQITQSGLNMGWPLYEGAQAYQGNNPAGLTMPVAQYGHGSNPFQGNSITGGFVYRGPVEPLQGLYIFADFVSGNIWVGSPRRASFRLDRAEQQLHQPQRSLRPQRRRA
jgi:hypothetical protein